LYGYYTKESIMSRLAKKNENSSSNSAAVAEAAQTRILFVCMGNICRSPTAKSVFDGMIRAAGLQGLVVADSAGTHAFHIGEAADPRAVSAAQRRGYDMSAHQARKVELTDFQTYDYILAMDWDNLSLLQRMAPRGLQHKLQLLMRFATEFEAATIGDPYHGGAQGFETALDYIEDACTGLMEVVRRRASMVAAA
jgi:protein-tyrosine phosphatase